MKVLPTELSGVLIVEPTVYEDGRGFFMETFQAAQYADHGIPGPFVQDNLSLSTEGVLRGLHFQNPHPQGKLVRVYVGEVYDVVVDIRLGSPTFGQWVAVRLSGENKRQLYVPEGCAHGFCVTSESALLGYKCSDYYRPAHERTIRWDDPKIAIDWPFAAPTLSDKDREGRTLAEIGADALPKFQEHD